LQECGRVHVANTVLYASKQTLDKQIYLFLALVYNYSVPIGLDNIVTHMSVNKLRNQVDQ
jgi:hypothetical protein